MMHSSYFRLLFLLILFIGFSKINWPMETYGSKRKSKLDNHIELSLKNLCIGYILKTHIDEHYDLVNSLPPDCLISILEMVNKILNISEKNNVIYEAAIKAPPLLVVLLDLYNIYVSEISENISINAPVESRWKNPNRIKKITPLQALLMRKRIDKSHNKLNPRIIIASMKALLDHGASTHTEYQTPSLLSIAIQNYPQSVALALLEYEKIIDVDYQNPLVTACSTEKLKVVERLLNLGANPDGPRKNGSPLREAARKNNRNIAQLLLANGASPNLGALHTAILHNSHVVQELLMDQGAHLNKKWGITPQQLLHYINKGWRHCKTGDKTVIIKRKKHFKYRKIKA